MARERDRVRSPRLMRFLLAIGVLLVIGLVSAYALMELTGARVLSTNNAQSESLEQVTNSENANSKQIPIDADSTTIDVVLNLAETYLANMNQSVLDYTAKLEKQERIDGELGELQFIELKVLSRTPRPGSQERYPLHAYFCFVEPSSSAGREVIWIEGKNDGNLIAHEAGFMNIMRVNLAPTSYLAMKGNKYPADQVGLENLLRKLIEKGQRDRDIDGCIVQLEKGISWEDRTVDKLVVTHPRKVASVDFHRAEILLDSNLKLPVSYVSYLWPKTEGAEPPLEEKYIYHNLQTNVGLTEADFDPDNPAYNFP